MEGSVEERMAAPGRSLEGLAGVGDWEGASRSEAVVLVVGFGEVEVEGCLDMIVVLGVVVRGAFWFSGGFGKVGGVIVEAGWSNGACGFILLGSACGVFLFLFQLKQAMKWLSVQDDDVGRDAIVSSSEV